jgi:hypothetical protein
LGEIQTAADWYRRASENWKAGGYPPIYADMVVRHGLVDHYETALDCLKFNRADWAGRPLLVRLYYHLTSMWWIHPSMWQLRLRARKVLQRLEALVQENAGPA